MEGFRKGDIKLLVASDIAARGLDIKGVTHIFNMDLPEDPKAYPHRVGRTGRMEEAGTAITVASEKELPLIKRYEKELKVKIAEKLISRGMVIDPPGKQG
jgi:superfamily II DNA/RNA helicase